MGKKIHRCKDTLGNVKTYTFFVEFPHEALAQLKADCKYLGIYEGDEIAYRMFVDADQRLPLDLRKEFIEAEKIYYDTEKQCRMILASETAMPEAKQTATEILQAASLLHPIWTLTGARRAKESDLASTTFEP